jgi:hypothetical protein
MWKKKAIAALAIAVLISVSANAYILLANHPSQPGSYTVIDVQAYDAQGNLIATRHVTNDPILLNFAIGWYGALWNTPNGYGTYPLNYTFMDGNSPNMAYGMGFMYYSHMYGYYAPLTAIYGFIGVGNDSTAVSPTNYKLGQSAGTAMLGAAPVSSELRTISGTHMNFTVSSSIILSNGGSVTETGLITQGGGATTFDATTAFLCTRDVFSAIVIPVGGAIAIQVTLVVNP